MSIIRSLAAVFGGLLLVILTVMSVIWCASARFRQMCRSVFRERNPSHSNTPQSSTTPTQPATPSHSNTPQSSTTHTQPANPLLSKDGTTSTRTEAAKPLLTEEVPRVLEAKKISTSIGKKKMPKNVPDVDRSVIDPKKVAHLGNIDQVSKLKQTAYAREVEAGLMEEELEETTQRTTTDPIHTKVKINEEMCLLYESDQLRTLDEVLDGESADILEETTYISEDFDIYQ